MFSDEVFSKDRQACGFVEKRKPHDFRRGVFQHSVMID